MGPDLLNMISSINLNNVNTKILPYVAAGAAGLYLYSKSVLFTDAGITYVVQNNINGSLTVYNEPGLHLRVPFFSKVVIY